jgi:integrin beta 3
MPASLRSFTDAAADAVAREIATLRREAQRERDLREAEHRARMAELEARLLSAVDLERRLDDRLAALKDGDPGPRGEPGVVDMEAVRGLVAEEVAAIPAPEPGAPGRDGADADMEAVAEMVSKQVRDAVAALPPAEKGEPGRDAEPVQPSAIREAVRQVLTPVEGIADPVRAAVDSYFEANPVRDGAPGRDGRDVEDVEVMQDGRLVELGFTVGETRSVFQIELPEGEPGKDGEPGPRGDAGPEGKLPIVAAWTDDVQYEGAVRTHAGGTWQALRDTAREPPHTDWACLSAPGANGKDAQAFVIRGTWDAEATYEALNVVALNGASFVAKRENPGPCPGEGWQLMAAQGKRGAPGERGAPGGKGDRGPPGPGVVSLSIDDEALATLTNADGSVVTCDFYPLLSRLR